MRKIIGLATATMIGSLMTSGLAMADTMPCETKLPIDIPSNCDAIKVIKPIEKLENFRPLTTPKNGPALKPQTVFRSDQLDNLTKADQEKLSALGIETIVDLRAPDELEKHPNKHISTVDFNINLPIGSDPADVKKIMPLDVASQIGPLWFSGKFDEIDQLLKDHNVDLYNTRIDRYKDFARKFTPQISRFMHVLLEEQNYPLVFHCAGGKDRTGYVAAVLMLSLGFSEEDVMRDYLTTNLYTYDELSKLVADGPHSLRPAFGAHKEQITAALQAVKEDYGSFDTYRREALGISDEELAHIKKNLLADPT
ncbi:Tyrosine-protein phosphatase precursor [Pseudovibrio sp. Ad46]|uniref:tyrosine-protein phosphatase n=1 Tax=Pseudovibrio sp. Ad46 TaxID=989432 RepID=UPI0007B19EE4|nr:tyrosine-protein phosphatase [Pseudovibrio sp. Ad46]KZK91322.1 Tyrosine-protein phosphatase precursor [Pseudovibrio sp. Ad46]